MSRARSRSRSSPVCRGRSIPTTAPRVWEITSELHADRRVVRRRPTGSTTSSLPANWGPTVAPAGDRNAAHDRRRSRSSGLGDRRLDDRGRGAARGRARHRRIPCSRAIFKSDGRSKAASIRCVRAHDGGRIERRARVSVRAARALDRRRRFAPGSWGLEWLGRRRAISDRGRRFVRRAIGWLLGKVTFTIPRENALARTESGVVALAGVLPRATA